MEKRKQFRKSIGRNTVNPGNLAEQIQYGNKTTDMKMWRTPDNIAGGSNLPGIKKALDEGHLKRPSGQPMQIRLQDQVREERLHPQPQKWPTPTANEDAAGRPTGKMQKMLGNHPDVRGMGGGTLNPTWVEWLMGYPKGWTDLNLSVTPWFPPSPTTSDSASSSPTWPTPMARSHSTPRLPETMAKTGRNPLTNTLEDAVQYREIEKRKKWPTPRSRDWKDGYGVPPSVQKGTRGHTLGTKVQEEEKKKIKMWPTPTANDGKRGEINKDGTVKETWKKRKDRWAAKGVNMHRPLDIAVALDEEENKDEKKNKDVANTKSD
jgi:DNA (cytosine-5)-methyltransferase 1